MNELKVKIPDSMYKKLKEFSKEEGITANQFINSAIAEKISVFFSEEYMKKRVNKASKEKYFNVLSKVKNTKPDDFDQI